MKFKIILLAICLLIILSAATACGANDEYIERNLIKNPNEMQLAQPEEGEIIAVISTDLGNISMRLFPNEAPMAVENFIGLAEQNYFDGITFHRVVQDFVIQSGDAQGTGAGGATIWNNTPYPLEINDNLHHYTGAVGIAHSGTGEDNQSQFYIIQTPNDSVSNSAAVTLIENGLREDVAEIYKEIGGAPHLDNLHTVFAQVFKGMDVVDAIAQTEVDENGQPLNAILINDVEIIAYTKTAEQGDEVSDVTAQSTVPVSSASQGAVSQSE